MSNYILVWLILCSSFLTAKDAESPSALIQQSADIMDLRTLPSAVFHLYIDVTLKAVKDGEISGTYEERREGERTRIEVNVGAYREVYINDGSKAWSYANAIRPVRVIEALWALVPRPLNPDFVDTKFESENRKIAGSKFYCMTGRPNKGYPNTWCVDPDTKLLRWFLERVPFRFEYSNYQPFQGKQFPRTIRSYEDDRLVAELQVKQLVAEAVPANSFSPDQGMHTASSSPLCDFVSDADASTTNKVQPVYPESARQRRIQGSVVFFALIGIDGRIQKLETISSSDNDLENSARTAVQQWTFKPFTGCGEPTPFQSPISVHYSLSR